MQDKSWEDLVKQFIGYAPKTGEFTWIKRPSPTACVGKKIGQVGKSGYAHVEFRGKTVLLHRLVWWMEKGHWPEGDIDHKNNNRLDNRIENLRDVSKSHNLQNQKKAHVTNKSGLLGAHFSKGSFLSCIRVEGKNMYLGSFKSAEDAHEAYMIAKKKYHAGSIHG